jgi:hypothetical protein
MIICFFSYKVYIFHMDWNSMIHAMTDFNIEKLLNHGWNVTWMGLIKGFLCVDQKLKITCSTIGKSLEGLNWKMLEYVLRDCKFGWKQTVHKWYLLLILLQNETEILFQIVHINYNLAVTVSGHSWFYAQPFLDIGIQI